MTRTSSQAPAAGNTLPGQHTTTTQLTVRQVAILRLAAAGLSQKQIARHLRISVRTVQAHFRGMRQRTGARSHGELIAHVARAGLLAPGTPPPSKPGRRPEPPASQARRHPPGSPHRPYPRTMARAPGDSATAARDETQPARAGTRDETQPARAGTRDETRAGTSRCQVCGTPLAAARTGRPRRYCSRACQARAYRTRHQAGLGPISSRSSGRSLGS